ncbi:hypothetical protein B0H63DRAFT_401399 [Podospora didyma]|uniref:CBM1 domain-containing protein n=1 Tax=Podospora didyma TaxID=330526 RepID=A0AAE0N771_9PEZI|nr:hypothetical protein B0H63DRAFT_401399 [Podospora didyma]
MRLPRIRLPSWLSWYKKPEYRDFREYATTVSTGKRSLSPDGRKSAIPTRLRLERILANKTCSPMSLYDFYMYLKYIEHSAENLEFYIWYKNYESSYAKGLTVIHEKDYGFIASATESTSSVAEIKQGPELQDDEEEDTEPCMEMSSNHILIARETLARISQLISSDALSSAKGKCGPQIVPARFPNFERTNAAVAGLKILNPGPGSRSEIETVIELFLMPGAEKELNIPPAMRQQALADLAASSHPAALKPVADHVYGLLRNCSHRNFVRLGVGNGTFETICVATLMGIGNLIGGFLVVLCRGFAPYRGAHTRWEAFAAWPLWWLGLSLILSGLRGSCFFLLLFSRRQRLPWERFDDTTTTAPQGSIKSTKGGIWKTLSRLMIFDRRLRVKEAHLRRLQRKIVLQSLFGGSLRRSASARAAALAFLAAATPAALAASTVQLYGQCGGIGYTGAVQCASGAVCTAYNPWYCELSRPFRPKERNGMLMLTFLACSAMYPRHRSTDDHVVEGSAGCDYLQDEHIGQHPVRQCQCQCQCQCQFRCQVSYHLVSTSLARTTPSPGNPLGNPALPGWTASGGLNWVGFLTSLRNTSTLLTYNFAAGGATTNATLVTPWKPEVLSLIDQVAQFSGSIASQPRPAYAPWTANNTLVGIWMGVNDVGNSWWKENYTTEIVPQIMDTYFGQLQVVYNAGARNFVLLGVPPIQKTPAVLSSSTDSQAAEGVAIGQYNDQIASRLAAFKTKNSGVKAVLVDTAAPFNKALSNPTAYGAPDATCYNGDGVSCLWFNDYHPAVAINGLVADAVAEAWRGSFF